MDAGAGGGDGDGDGGGGGGLAKTTACTLPYDRKVAEASNTSSVAVASVSMNVSLLAAASSGNRTVKETVTLPAEIAVICTRYGSTPAELATVVTNSVRKAASKARSSNC